MSFPSTHRWKELWREAGLLLRLTVERAGRDGTGVTASALAFVTVISLVPLLAAFLFIGTRAFSEYEPKALALLVEILPYSEAALNEKIKEFVRQAEGVQGIGVLFFITTALTAFGTVERVINRAWGVPQQRPFRHRIQSFTLLLFWGSLLLGGGFSVAVSLFKNEGFFARLGSSGLGSLLSVGIVLSGLTMLYWLVPYTTVSFRHALLGATMATFFLQLLRQVFAVYASFFPGFQLVYGSLAFVFLFMVSIQIAWWIVLVGNQLTYVAQHFDALAHSRRTGGRLPGPWLGLAAVLLLAERLEDGEPITPFPELASRLRVPRGPLRGALRPLIHAGTVREAGSGMEAYILGGSPRHLSVNDLFEQYAPRSATLAAVELSGRLEELRQCLHEARTKSLGPLSIADLLDTPTTGCEPTLPSEDSEEPEPEPAEDLDASPADVDDL